MISQASQDAIARAWADRAEAQDHGKPTSAKYRRAQAEFVAGAAAALNAVFPNDDNPELLSRAVPPGWIINTLLGRDPFNR